MPTYPASSAVSGGGGQITLQEIERALAPRVGPHKLGADGLGEVQTGTAMANRAYFDTLASTAGIEGITDLYMLRRGNLSSGSTVAVVAGDRVRMVAAHDPTDGSVTPDRNWATPPIGGELVEFHHLDPERELRRAVRDGLRRCYFETRVSVTTSSTSAERDLSAVLSWLTAKGQLRRVQHQAVGVTTLPADVVWTGSFEAAGHVWLAGSPDPYPDTLLVTALRPHYTWVNGADSTTGPTADADLLSLDLNYAVAAAHIEAWRICKPRLLQAAEDGYQITQAQAADEFTRQAEGHVQRRPRTWTLSAPFGSDQLSSVAR